MGAIELRLYVFRLIHCLRGGVWKRGKFGLWEEKKIDPQLGVITDDRQLEA